MKKILSCLFAVLLILSCIPAFAENIEDTESGRLFDTAVTLVRNEPDTAFDEWDVPYNVWVPAEKPKLKIGDDAAFMLTYSVPAAAEIKGCTEKQLASIEYLVDITGIRDVRLIEAQNCPPKMECDYEKGLCRPISGEYANITVNKNGCRVMAELNKQVVIVLRGTLTASAVNCSVRINIGQYRFPAQFTIDNNVMTVEKKREGCYSAHHSDFIRVQKHAVEYRNSRDGKSCEKFVALNGHYHRIVVEGGAITGFIPVNEKFADSGEPIDMKGGLAADLTAIFNGYADFFNIPCDKSSVTDADFIGNAEHDSFEYDTEIGGKCSFDLGEKKNAKPGETVAVEFSVYGGYSAHDLMASIGYDADMLSAEKVVPGSVLTENAKNIGAVYEIDCESKSGVIGFGMNAPVDPLTQEGVIFTVIFKVDGKAAPNTEIPLTLNIMELVYMPIGEKPVSVEHTVYNGCIAVSDEPNPNGQPTEAPTAKPAEPPHHIPITGAISLAGLGVALIICGVLLILNRKRSHNN